MQSFQNSITLAFSSICSTGAPDYVITMSVSSTSPLQVNTPYVHAITQTSQVITTITYEAKNCGGSAPQYMNLNSVSGTYNGTFTFTVIDTVNKLVSGNCSGVTLYSTTSPSAPNLTLDFTFYNVPFIII